jgi:hypothetical protein
MSITNDRLVNGLLKVHGGNATPNQVKAWLSQDVEIVAPPERSTESDLWPAIWALAAILERQLHGHVYIRCGLKGSLAAPSRMGPRCRFVDQPQPAALSILLGLENNLGDALVGDARRGTISVGCTFGHVEDAPSAIECFVLAGFLGFAVIARFTGIPGHREDFTRHTLEVTYDPRRLNDALAQIEGFTCVGVGQVGQALLALLFFLYNGDLQGRRVSLIDKDTFETENGRTQLLLADGAPWDGKDKVTYLAPLVSAWNAEAVPHREKIEWGWRRTASHPPVSLLGLHDLEARRMACAAGFDRILEAGVGTDLLKPRVSWHALPGNDPTLGRRLFKDESRTGAREERLSGEWVDELKGTPGGCGWVQFMGIAATAPCLGAAAAAFALAELGEIHQAVSGSALLWSQCIAPYREATSLSLL